MPLLKLIQDEIESKGPMSVARYMSLALMHPEFGYYQTREVFGGKGDFITAPEISQIFGELVGAWCAEQWLKMGSLKATLVELGPGRGTLMSDALRATKNVPGFHDAVNVKLIESSAKLRTKQADTLQEKHPRISWQPTIEPLPDTPLLIIANEFFDALPIQQFSKNEERKIAYENNKLVFVNTPSPNPLPRGERAFSPPSPLVGEGRGEGNFHEICEVGLRIMETLSHHIKKHGGAMIVADYGYLGGSHGDSLQAMKGHKYHPVLENPGEADITAHVDFDALANVAHTENLQVNISTQSDWLRRMGAELRAIKLCEKADDKMRHIILSGLERLMSPAQMGELFKVMEITPSSPESLL